MSKNTSNTAAQDQATNNNLNNDPLFDGSEDIDELILSFLPEEERAQLEKEATAFVGDSLLLHDDLEARALELLQEVNRDRDESILALRNTANEQLNAVRRGMDRFGKAEKAMRDLGTSFSEMDTLISTMQSVSSYHQIRKLHYYHENLSNVVKWTECIAAFDPKDGAKEMEMILRGTSKLGEEGVFHVPTEEERATFQTAKNFELVYQNLRVMQAIRARLSIDSIAHEHRLSIQVIRRHLEEGERLLEIFLTNCLDIIRRAPEICVEYILVTAGEDAGAAGASSPDKNKAIRERNLLFAIINIANQESREPALYENIDVAAYHFQLSLQRMAGKGGEVAKSDTQINSLLSWPMLSKHLDSGVRTFFYEYCCVDSSADPDRKDKGVEEQLADVKSTCDALDSLLEPYCECIEKALTDASAPIGNINLLPHIMKQIHQELCNLIEIEYCDPQANVDVTELLRCLELTVSYRENSLEKGTIGQFVSFSAMERVSTFVLENAVSGMRDYLSTNARNCALRVLDKDVKVMPTDQTLFTEGPGDMLFIVTSMLKAVTKNATNDVRSKMSMACATALRYYVDQFCEKIEFGPEKFESWYAKIAPPELIAAGTDAANSEESSKDKDSKKDNSNNNSNKFGDRWLMWICAAINDFTELQRNVGKLDASLFDLQHQSTSAISGGGGDHDDAGAGAAADVAGDDGKTGKRKGNNNKNRIQKSSLTPLQTFASILGKQVFMKLIGRMSDYLEIKVLPEKFAKICDASRYLPPTSGDKAVTTSDRNPTTGVPFMQEVIDEIRPYITSISSAVHIPWNSVANRTIVVRMIQVYVTKLLATIRDGLESKTTRGSLAAKMGDDLRIWTGLCVELPQIEQDQLRYEDRSDNDVMPDLGGTIGVLRVLLRLVNVDSVDAFRAALKEDVSCFCDVPEWLYEIMFENSKAASDLSSSIKSQMKKMWKEHIDAQTKMYSSNAALMNQQLLDSGDDEDEDGGIYNDDENEAKKSANNTTAGAGLKPNPQARRSIFGTLDKDQVIPKKTGWFSKSRDEGPKVVGERLGKIKICFDTIHIREAQAPLPKFGQKKEFEVISLSDLIAREAANKEKAQQALVSEN